MGLDSLKKAQEFWSKLELTNIEDRSFITKDGTSIGYINYTYTKIPEPETEDIEHEIIEPKQLPPVDNEK